MADTLLSDLDIINEIMESSGDNRFKVCMGLAKQARQLQDAVPGLEEKDAVTWAIRGKKPAVVEQLLVNEKIRNLPGSKYDDLNYIEDLEVRNSVEMSLDASKVAQKKTYRFVDGIRPDDPRRRRVRILVNRLYEHVFES